MPLTEKIEIHGLTALDKRTSVAGQLFTWNEWKHTTPRPDDMRGMVQRLSPCKGYDAELIDGVWFWVPACPRCTGSGKAWAYHVCEEHNTCVSCGIHRSKLTAIPWGHRDGFQCKDCAARAAWRLLRKIYAEFVARGRSPKPYQDHKIWCPHCGNDHDPEGSDYNMDGEAMTCGMCSRKFTVTAHHAVTFETEKIRKTA